MPMTEAARQIVLASASPRRRDLIQELGIPVVIEPSHTSEDVAPDITPVAMVSELAVRKAASIAAERRGAVVIGADTTVEIDSQILNKPHDLADAERMLRTLRGREHQVHTGVAIIAPDHAPVTEVMTSAVLMHPFSDSALHTYLATGESLDKAGAYGIQGAAGDIVESVTGCYTNVVGLPLCSVVRSLLEAGVAVTTSTPRCGFRSDRRCPYWPNRK
jgi:septum formation protein